MRRRNHTIAIDDDDDDDVYYYIHSRLNLEGETENIGVCTKERSHSTFRLAVTIAGKSRKPFL